MEHDLDSSENLTVELQRNFTLMRDLDSRAQELMREIDKRADDYMANVKGFSVKKKNETMISIQRLFDKAKEYGDDKVQLSIQFYKLVDKHIRKLNSDIARFEAEIQDKAIRATKKIEEGSQNRLLVSGGGKKTKDKEIKKKRESSEEETVTKTSKKKQLKKVRAKSTSAAPSKTPLVSVVTNPTNPTNSVASVTVKTNSPTGALIGAGVAHLAEVLDIDPNEPTFCLCKQVFYGEMIACDNPECHIEWFHFGCVQLITKPKGKWFCPKCITNRKKK